MSFFRPRPKDVEDLEAIGDFVAADDPGLPQHRNGIYLIDETQSSAADSKRTFGHLMQGLYPSNRRYSTPINRKALCNAIMRE